MVKILIRKSDGQFSENKVPNLDGMSDADLMAFWKRYRRPKRKDAAELIGDTRKGYTNLASLLAAYAVNKATAMTCRAKGDIQGAETYEHGCRLVYERLPQDLRW
jgi:hypothetical protein